MSLIVGTFTLKLDSMVVSRSFTEMAQHSSSVKAVDSKMKTLQQWHVGFG